MTHVVRLLLTAAGGEPRAPTEAPSPLISKCNRALQLLAKHVSPLWRFYSWVRAEGHGDAASHMRRDVAWPRSPWHVADASRAWGGQGLAPHVRHTCATRATCDV